MTSLMTTKQFEKLLTALPPKRKRHHAGDGLYLQIGAARWDKITSSLVAGPASWQMRYEQRGREHWMGLGSARLFGLQEARKRALEWRILLVDGKSPLEAKRAKQTAQAAAVIAIEQSMTFGAAFGEWFAAQRVQWKAKHAGQVKARMEQHALPVLRTVPVVQVDTPDVLRVLEKIWYTMPNTARRVRGYIADVLDWAKTRGLRKGDNPASWSGHLDNVLPSPNKVRKVEHHPALDYRDAPSFMQELRAREGLNARALELLVLCASRTAEVLDAPWDEFDLDAALWTIPKERMKKDRDHVVPLVPRAVQILRSLPRQAGATHVFGGTKIGRPLGKMTFLKLLDAMGHKEITAHGFRATFRTWAGECTNFPREIAEAALSHYVGGTEGAYQRGELLVRRRKLMEAWSSFCYSPSRAATVTDLRQRIAART